MKASKIDKMKHIIKICKQRQPEKVSGLILSVTLFEGQIQCFCPFEPFQDFP